MTILLLLSSLHLAAGDVSPITFSRDGDRFVVRAVLSGRLLADVPEGKLTQDQGERWLRFTLLDPDTGRAGEGILGSYERQRSCLLFTPRHPLAAGQRYRATLTASKDNSHSAEYRAPEKPQGARAVVDKIYPTAAVLPANQLKFYLHFSRPMREGRDVFERLHLRAADGKDVPDPWRHTELWNAERTRLTLWIHPGRVKRGVNLREELGPVLKPQCEYTLVIGATLIDAEGQPLGKEFTKKFRTTAEKRVRPAVGAWKLELPAAGARAPLVVRFPEPLDRALLDRFVHVVGPDGKPVAGRIEIGEEEKVWRFVPDKAWQNGDYRLVADERLEDLAGNTPLRLFDVDLAEPAPAAAPLSVGFRPR